MCRKWLYCKITKTKAQLLSTCSLLQVPHYFGGLSTWTSHTQSVIRDLLPFATSSVTFIKPTKSSIFPMCTSQELSESLYWNSFTPLLWQTRPEPRIGGLQSHFHRVISGEPVGWREHTCCGELPMSWGGRCSTVSPFPQPLPLPPARSCNSPITQWRMSRCCEILFLKCTCLNSL